MTDIYSIGGIYMDVCLSIDVFPEADEARKVSRITIQSGGCASNFAVAVSRLSMSCGIIGAVGDDEYGRILTEELTKEGVNIEGLVIKRGQDSGKVFIPITRDGSKLSYTYSGANEQLRIEDVEIDKISKAKIVQVFDPPDDVLNSLPKLSSQKFLFAPVGVLSRKGGRSLSDIIQKSDILFLNEPETRIMTGASSLEQGVEKLFQYGCNLLVITRGAKGSYIYTSPGERIVVPPYTNIQVVDTTGAGDAFIAGFCYSLLEGMAYEEIGAFASIAAALTTTKVGARAALPSLPEVMKVYSRTNL